MSAGGGEGTTDPVRYYSSSVLWNSVDLYQHKSKATQWWTDKSHFLASAHSELGLEPLLSAVAYQSMCRMSCTLCSAEQTDGETHPFQSVPTESKIFALLWCCQITTAAIFLHFKEWYSLRRKQVLFYRHSFLAPLCSTASCRAFGTNQCWRLGTVLAGPALWFGVRAGLLSRNTDLSHWCAFKSRQPGEKCSSPLLNPLCWHCAGRVSLG